MNNADELALDVVVVVGEMVRLRIIRRSLPHVPVQRAFSCVLLNSLLYHKADQLALDARRRATRVGIARPGLANNIDDVVEDL